MFKSFILPLFDYADVIWDNCTDAQANTLEQLQIDALRTISGSVRGTSHALLYNETGFVPLKERRKRHKLLLYFKFTKGLLPNYLDTKFPPLASEVNTYHRRRPLDRQPPQCNSESYKKTYFPAATTLWNSLPEEIQKTNSFGEFKRFLRKDDIVVPPYYYIRNGKEQIIPCKMRLGMSDLQDDLFNRHLSDIKKCACGANKENALHFLLYCPLFTQARYITLSTLPPITKNIKTLLNGNKNYSVQFNSYIFLTVQEFIKNSSRFE